MLIRTPKQTVKVSCKKCNWYLVIYRGGTGCVLSPHEMRIILLNTSLNSCPKCGGSELIESIPSIIERINPWEGIKRMMYYHQNNKPF